MSDWIGRLNEKGSPVIPIQLEDASSNRTAYEALLDTGFDGFLCLPLSFLALFKDEIDDVRKITLADGRKTMVLEVRVNVFIENERIAGTGIIVRGGNEVILGMQFLKIARRSLCITPSKNTVVLPKDL